MKDTKTGKKKLVTKSDVLVIHHSLNNYYTDWQMLKKSIKSVKDAKS